MPKRKWSARKAAWALDAIRNDRTTDKAELLKRVDEIGHWLATQCMSNMVVKLLGEASDLARKFS